MAKTKVKSKAPVKPEPVVVEREYFERLHKAYSGQLLASNRCHAVELKGRLWTVVSLQGKTNGLMTATLVNLVLPVLYRGKTGPYPMGKPGSFYKGQLVNVRDVEYVINGQPLTVVDGGDRGLRDPERGDGGVQQELFTCTVPS